MPYSTVAMVRMALVPSSDGTLPDPPSNTAADLTDAQLEDAIAEADSTIDGYISKYYAVPVLPKIAGDGEDGVDGQIPHPIDFWSRNIAAYNATLAYREGQDFDDTDPVARRYNATIMQLKAVSGGGITLALPSNAGPSAAVGAGAPFNPYIGDMFTPSDFNLRPMPPDWPNGSNVPFNGHW